MLILKGDFPVLSYKCKNQEVDWPEYTYWSYFGPAVQMKLDCLKLEYCEFYEQKE